MTSDSNNLIGKTLGTCTLEKLIGQGGMGAVYLAQQARPARHVAVKVLLPSITMNKEVYRAFLARFQREANVIAKLEHVNIMPIYEYGEQDGLAYLVMPYLPGGSLRDVLTQRGPLSLSETTTYIDQAASALDYAHAHEVIHRDIKPGNFLLHADGRLILADFGIAHIMQDSNSTTGSTLTGTGMLLGTPEYMAPEMLRGERIDHRADIYELGIVLFQMLSGQVPFRGDTPYAVIAKHIQESPPSLHQMNPAIPPAVDAVVQQAIAKKREDRFPSAKALVQALRTAAISPYTASDTYARNAPTVLSSSPPNQAAVIPMYNTPPPVQPVLRSATEPRTPPWSANQPPLGRRTPPLYPPQPTPLPSRSTQSPWLIFIGVLLVVALVVGGVLIGLQLNRGETSSSNAPSTVSTTPQATSTTNPTAGTTAAPTQAQTGGIPLGTLLYSASSPGSSCDSGGGHWADFNSAVLSCQATATVISNPHSQSPNLVGTLLTSLPNNSQYPADYIIEAQLQQASTSHAEFGIYFRNQPGNQQGVYTFLIRPDGSWRAYIYDNTTGAPSVLASGGTIGSAYTSITIDVVVIGTNFTFYVNKQRIGSASNATYPTGTIGVAVDAGGTISVGKMALYRVG